MDISESLALTSTQIMSVIRIEIGHSGSIKDGAMEGEVYFDNYDPGG